MPLCDICGYEVGVRHVHKTTKSIGFLVCDYCYFGLETGGSDSEADTEEEDELSD